MGKATIPSKTLHHSKLQRVVAAKNAKTFPGAAHNPVSDNSTVKIPFMRTLHTPRTIRLANDPNRHRMKPPVIIKAALSRQQAKASGRSGPLVVRQARQMAVWEEPVPTTIFMDYTGHCHAKLDDGGYLYMDQFGHCHSKLDDGGYLYMDPQGSVHTSLNDQAPQSSLPHSHANLRVHHPVPRSAAYRSHEALVAMLGDLNVSQKSRAEQEAHDRELRALHDKPLMAPSHSNMRSSKSNKNNRRSRSIAQPRKLS